MKASRLIPAIVILVVAAFAIVLLSSCGRNENSTNPPVVQSPSAPEQESPRPVPTVEKPVHKHKHSHVATEPATVPQTTEAGPPAVSDHQPVSAQELRRGPDGSNKVALTFDAGASAKPTPELLSILRRNGVKATFFLTGKWVEQNPELVKQIVADGHVIGNHTYSHPDLRKLTDDEIREQLRRVEDMVHDATGVSTKPYFRPPFGGRDQRVLDVAASEGYQCVYWTVDSWDAFKKGIQPSEIEGRVLDRASGGSVVLMHCGSWPTVKALQDIITDLRAKGYELVTVPQLETSH